MSQENVEVKDIQSQKLKYDKSLKIFQNGSMNHYSLWQMWFETTFETSDPRYTSPIVV